MIQRRRLFQFRLKFIVLHVSLLGLSLSSCKPGKTNGASLSDRINDVGIRIAKDNTPVELLTLEPRTSRDITVDAHDGCRIGFYVQGIGEDLVEIHKKTGKFPARMFNSRNEVLETSYAAARIFSAKDGKANLTIQSNHQTAIHVVIYTASAD